MPFSEMKSSLPFNLASVPAAEILQTSSVVEALKRRYRANDSITFFH
jgi:hypothetical protein